METDRYSTEYRRACLEAGREIVGALSDPGEGARHLAWTGEVFKALRLVAWGGGPVEDLAREAARKLHRQMSDAAQSAREARKREDAPHLPTTDAWERFLGAPRGSERPVRRAPTPPPARKAARPPWAELEALLDLCVPVVEDERVKAWLSGRGIDPGLVAEQRLAVALPVGSDCPAWAKGPIPGAPRWGAWARGGYRALMPLRCPRGWTRSVVARAVRPAKPKSLPPTGFERRGLVMANRAAVSALAGNSAPERVVVVEGEPDFLTVSVALPELPVLGVASGSWRPAFGARFGDSTTWHLATDDNRAGDQYAADVAKSLHPNATVYRTRVRALCARRGAELPSGADWNDAAQAGVLRLDDLLSDLIDASTPYATEGSA